MDVVFNHSVQLVYIRLYTGYLLHTAVENDSMEGVGMFVIEGTKLFVHRTGHFIQNCLGSRIRSMLPAQAGFDANKAFIVVSVMC